MFYFIKLFFLTLLIFLLIDLLWLGWIARGFYQQQLGAFLAERTNWAAAILFYLIFIGGLLHFVIQPALDNGTLYTAIFNGAFFGLVTYATYELTNLATHREWPLLLVVVDIAWGIVLSALVSAITFAVARFFQ